MQTPSLQQRHGEDNQSSPKGMSRRDFLSLAVVAGAATLAGSHAMAQTRADAPLTPGATMPASGGLLYPQQNQGACDRAAPVNGPAITSRARPDHPSAGRYPRDSSGRRSLDVREEALYFYQPDEDLKVEDIFRTSTWPHRRSSFRQRGIAVLREHGASRNAETVAPRIALALWRRTHERGAWGSTRQGGAGNRAYFAMCPRASAPEPGGSRLQIYQPRISFPISRSVINEEHIQWVSSLTDSGRTNGTIRKAPQGDQSDRHCCDRSRTGFFRFLWTWSHHENRAISKRGKSMSCR